uniref:Dual specificity phosphatase catalytic domain n=1 Tax=viral metagenome TaxID=1070528 RepID=A0A6C0B3H3_9ZZZZ
MDYIYNAYCMSQIFFDKGSYYISNKELDDYIKTKRVFGSNSKGLACMYDLTYKPDFIIKQLLLGNAYNARNFYALEKDRIGLIINCSKDIPNYFEDEIEYLRVNVEDKLDQCIYKYLDTTITAMHEYLTDNPNKNILVHCFMGSSRSATVIIAYLIKYRKYTRRDALLFLKQKRHLVNINVDFFKQLKLFEEEYR